MLCLTRELGGEPILIIGPGGDTLIIHLDSISRVTWSVSLRLEGPGYEPTDTLKTMKRWDAPLWIRHKGTGESIRVSVEKTNPSGRWCKIGIEADVKFAIFRKELWDAHGKDGLFNMKGSK